MSDQPNILFIHSDEHSFRYMSSRPHERGGEPCRTPTLDGLIDRGTHFDAAYCQMPLCTPSRISMLTGRHSHRCGAWGNASVLPPELPTIGSHFRQNGYATATIGKMHLGGSLQTAGFGDRPYGDFGGPCAHQPDPLSADGDLRSRTLDAGISDVPEAMIQENVVARTALAWAREQRHSDPDQPWLLYTSFSRPHFPLTAPKRFFDRYYPEGVTPPRVTRSGDSADHPMTLGAIEGFKTEDIESEEGRRARAAYFAAVDFLDEILGDFLAVMERDGLLDNTVIVYTSDHGELAGEHGLWWKNTWHESASRVPLIISLPDHRSDRLDAGEIADPVSLADLFPTLCGLSGIAPPEGLDGIDLTDAVNGRPCQSLTARPGVITESLSPRWGEGTEFRMLRTRTHKYVAFRGCDDLCFDLDQDPDEQIDLLGSGEEMAELKNYLLDGFSFDEATEARLRETEDRKSKYPPRFTPKTPNQIVLGDGRLVEADASLYHSEVLSNDLSRDLDDWPGDAS